MSMAKCPKCFALIAVELEQVGGECPNCFENIEGSIGHCDEFEPTGIFTREHLRAIANAEVTGKADFTDELLTDEIDLDDVLVFDDEATEILEKTEPLPVTVSHKDELMDDGPTADALGDAEDDFDFDDEPTIALSASVSVTTSETLQGSQEDEIPEILTPDVVVQTPTKEAMAGKSGSFSLKEKSAQKSNSLDDELSEEESEGFLDDVSEVAGDVIQGMGGIGISPQAERGSTKELKPIVKQKTFDFKPVLLTMLLIGGAAAVIFTGGEESNVETLEPVADVFVPEVQTGSLEKPKIERKSTTTKTKQTKASKVNKPTAVEAGGVKTFQTAKPVMTSKSPTGQAAVGGKSAKLERDVSRLKKSLKYCHTKALKNDPTVAGKWEVAFKVQSGSASNVNIKAMRAKNAEIEACMDTKIKRFAFHDGSTQNFKFRILFER